MYNICCTTSVVQDQPGSPRSIGADSGGPTALDERIVSLDVIRGVAILGILVMNALSFGLDQAAYFNVPAGGTNNSVDWIIGVVAMVFFDQKMMALFSLLFGVGVVIFAERAASKSRPATGLSLWRFALLGIAGLVHISIWGGDVLFLYALCAPVVLLIRRLPVLLLGSLGVALALVGAITAPLFQATAGGTPDGLKGFWFTGYEGFSSAAEGWFILNAATRALGLMLLGVALYRMGIVQGHRDDTFYRRLAIRGLGFGTIVTVMGIVWRVVTDWSADLAITGTIPTSVGTIPMALGYMAIIIIWSRSGSSCVAWFARAGQMALTNYLTQTIVGLVTLRWLFGDTDLTRTMIAVWIVGVWILQLWWSTKWLAHFRYGLFEWGWRCATYRRRQPLRRVA